MQGSETFLLSLPSWPELPFLYFVFLQSNAVGFLIWQPCIRLFEEGKKKTERLDGVRIEVEGTKERDEWM